MIASLRQNGYNICGYRDYTQYDKCAILRHDVDHCLKKALVLAQLENKLCVKSTYFLLLTSEFYNVAAKENYRIIGELRKLGHEIGLHFDEANYPSGADVPALIGKECSIMSEILGFPIEAVSMHRPSKETLAADYKLHGLVNSYSKTFFEDFKYISDSRRYWREPVMDIINSNVHNRLHILTHAFWYSEEGLSAEDVISTFVNGVNLERYKHMAKNIRDFDGLMKKEDVK